MSKRNTSHNQTPRTRTRAPPQGRLPGRRLPSRPVAALRHACAAARRGRAAGPPPGGRRHGLPVRAPPAGLARAAAARRHAGRDEPGVGLRQRDEFAARRAAREGRGVRRGARREVSRRGRPRPGALPRAPRRAPGSRGGRRHAPAGPCFPPPRAVHRPHAAPPHPCPGRGTRPAPPGDAGPDLPVHAALLYDTLYLYRDLGGGSLHRRGARGARRGARGSRPSVAAAAARQPG